MGTHPVVANHLNIPKPPAGEPTLLTYDEVKTMFHEFGHALHGMFSNVKYPLLRHQRAARLRRVSVASQRDVGRVAGSAANYAKHYQTGAPMPQELLDKVIGGEEIQPGFHDDGIPVGGPAGPALAPAGAKPDPDGRAGL
jgi:peptidyl-dipeptidase Dcp